MAASSASSRELAASAAVLCMASRLPPVRYSPAAARGQQGGRLAGATAASGGASGHCRGHCAVRRCCRLTAQPFSTAGLTRPRRASAPQPAAPCLRGGPQGALADDAGCRCKRTTAAGGRRATVLLNSTPGSHLLSTCRAHRRAKEAVVQSSIGDRFWSSPCKRRGACCRPRRGGCSRLLLSPFWCSACVPDHCYRSAHTL